MNNFLFINPFGIGDVLFTTPLVRAIRYNWPESIIGYWCNERVKDILESSPHIDRIFALSRGDIKRLYGQSKIEGIRSALDLFNNIKKGHFDISIDFSLDQRYALVCKFAGIKRRIGFNYKNRGRFLTDRINIDSYHDKHVVEYYLDLLKFIDIKPQDPRLELAITEESKIKTDYLLKNLGINNNDLVIGIAPGAGASWGKDSVYKHWPAEKFAQLSDRIINDFNAKILILGDEFERPIADTIINVMHKETIDLTGKTGLEDLGAIINNLRLLITNDGGPLHMAVALNVKTVSIFGPVDEKVYGPYPASDRHIVIKQELPCRPCYKNFHFTNCFLNRKCIEDITVEEVYIAVKRLIQ